MLLFVGSSAASGPASADSGLIAALPPVRGCSPRAPGHIETHLAGAARPQPPPRNSISHRSACGTCIRMSAANEAGHRHRPRTDPGASSSRATTDRPCSSRPGNPLSTPRRHAAAGRYEVERRRRGISGDRMFHCCEDISHRVAKARQRLPAQRSITLGFVALKSRGHVGRLSNCKPCGPRSRPRERTVGPWGETFGHRGTATVHQPVSRAS
jgi:hypothetical protein